MGATRTDEVTALISRVLPGPSGARPLYVVVEGPPEAASGFADALAMAYGGAALRLQAHIDDGGGATVVVGAGAERTSRPEWDAVIFLRTSRHDRGNGAHIVVDFHDPAWPIVRHIDSCIADSNVWHIPESRAFFGPRAETWDAKFGDDLPAYAAAVAEAGLRPGGTVLDLGCGTGRALPALRSAVGPAGTVVGVDVTPEMLTVARRRGGPECFALVMGDARCLPFAAGSVDGLFAAGLIQHLPDPRAGLAELARVTRPGGVLIVFHPSGRAALAARHGRALRADEPLSPERIGPLLASAGWELTCYDDPPHRFFATARRVGQ